MGFIGTDTAFVTWNDEAADREDPAFFTPSVLQFEERLAQSGAVDLGKVADLSADRFSPEESQSFSYIDIGSIDIRTGGIYATEVAASDAPSRARWKVSTGDILLSSVRPERGAVGRVPPILDGAVASSGFFVLRPIDGSHETADALFLFLLTDQFRKQAMRRAASSMYPVINEGQLKTVLVPLQILDEAGPAVSMLREADHLLARAAEELDAARQWMNRRLP
jgi:type I restriction enzyme S subunit